MCIESEIIGIDSLNLSSEAISADRFISLLSLPSFCFCDFEFNTLWEALDLSLYRYFSKLSFES